MAYYVTVTVATNMYYSNCCNRQGKAGLLNVATKLSHYT